MKKLTFTLIALTFFSCAEKTSIRLLPGESGLNKVEGVHSDKQKALQDATKSAQTYCEKMNKPFYFQKEETKYEGLFSEKETKAIRTAGTVGNILTGSTDAYWGSRAATGDSKYKAVVEFKCGEK